MKRISAFIAACAVMAGALASCASGGQGSVSSETKPARESKAPLDQALIGTWKGDAAGYRFQDDRKVSLLMDLSSSLHFNSDGSFVLAGETYSKDLVSFDGSLIKATFIYEPAEGEEVDESLLEPVDVIELSRKGEPDKSTFDGLYDVVGGEYISMIAQNLAIAPEKLSLEAEIDGENLNITAVDYCDYEVSDGLLEMFSENMQFVDENATSVKYRYEISGDELKLTYLGETEEGAADAPVEVLKKAD
ncbi:MAG: hypothetical protein J5501_04135 [Ruminococcus sp.]|nr:hypothetical protein [Ruminococcus sp.]